MIYVESRSALNAYIELSARGNEYRYDIHAHDTLWLTGANIQSHSNIKNGKNNVKVLGGQKGQMTYLSR